MLHLDHPKQIAAHSVSYALERTTSLRICHIFSYISVIRVNVNNLIDNLPINIKRMRNLVSYLIQQIRCWKECGIGWKSQHVNECLFLLEGKSLGF